METPPSFTLPFIIGLLVIISFLIVVSTIWIVGLSKTDKIRIIKGFSGFSRCHYKKGFAEIISPFP